MNSTTTQQFIEVPNLTEELPAPTTNGLIGLEEVQPPPGAPLDAAVMAAAFADLFSPALSSYGVTLVGIHNLFVLCGSEKPMHTDPVVAGLFATPLVLAVPMAAWGSLLLAMNDFFRGGAAGTAPRFVVTCDPGEGALAHVLDMYGRVVAVVYPLDKFPVFGAQTWQSPVCIAGAVHMVCTPHLDTWWDVMCANASWSLMAWVATVYAVANHVVSPFSRQAMRLKPANAAHCLAAAAPLQQGSLADLGWVRADEFQATEAKLGAAAAAVATLEAKLVATVERAAAKKQKYREEQHTQQRLLAVLTSQAEAVKSTKLASEESHKASLAVAQAQAQLIAVQTELDVAKKQLAAAKDQCATVSTECEGAKQRAATASREAATLRKTLEVAQRQSRDATTAEQTARRHGTVLTNEVERLSRKLEEVLDAEGKLAAEVSTAYETIDRQSGMIKRMEEEARAVSLRAKDTTVAILDEGVATVSSLSVMPAAVLPSRQQHHSRKKKKKQPGSPIVPAPTSAAVSSTPPKRASPLSRLSRGASNQHDAVTTEVDGKRDSAADDDDDALRDMLASRMVEASKQINDKVCALKAATLTGWDETQCSNAAFTVTKLSAIVHIATQWHARVQAKTSPFTVEPATILEAVSVVLTAILQPTGRTVTISERSLSAIVRCVGVIRAQQPADTAGPLVSSTISSEVGCASCARIPTPCEHVGTAAAVYGPLVVSHIASTIGDTKPDVSDGVTSALRTLLCAEFVGRAAHWSADPDTRSDDEESSSETTARARARRIAECVATLPDSVVRHYVHVIPHLRALARMASDGPDPQPEGAKGGDGGAEHGRHGHASTSAKATLPNGDPLLPSLSSTLIQQAVRYDTDQSIAASGARSMCDFMMSKDPLEAIQTLIAGVVRAAVACHVRATTASVLCCLARSTSMRVEDAVNTLTAVTSTPTVQLLGPRSFHTLESVEAVLLSGIVGYTSQTIATIIHRVQDTTAGTLRRSIKAAAMGVGESQVLDAQLDAALRAIAEKFGVNPSVAFPYGPTGNLTTALIPYTAEQIVYLNARRSTFFHCGHL